MADGFILFIILGVRDTFIVNADCHLSFTTLPKNIQVIDPQRQRRGRSTLDTFDCWLFVLNYSLKRNLRRRCRPSAHDIRPAAGISTRNTVYFFQLKYAETGENRQNVRDSDRLRRPNASVVSSPASLSFINRIETNWSM